MTDLLGVLETWGGRRPPRSAREDGTPSQSTAIAHRLRQARAAAARRRGSGSRRGRRARGPRPPGRRSRSSGSATGCCGPPPGSAPRANSVLLAGDPEVASRAALDGSGGSTPLATCRPEAQVIGRAPWRRPAAATGWARPARRSTRRRRCGCVGRGAAAPYDGVGPGALLEAADRTTGPGRGCAEDDRPWRTGRPRSAVLEGPERGRLRGGRPSEGRRPGPRAAGSERADVWRRVHRRLGRPAGHRRRGLALIVVRRRSWAWGAERGATTAYLQGDRGQPPRPGALRGSARRRHHRTSASPDHGTVRRGPARCYVAAHPPVEHGRQP